MGYGISHRFNIDRDRTIHPPIEGIMVNADSSNPETFIWWNPLKSDEQAFKMLVHHQLVLEYGEGSAEWVTIKSRAHILPYNMWRANVKHDMMSTIRQLTVQAVYETAIASMDIK